MTDGGTIRWVMRPRVSALLAAVVAEVRANCGEPPTPEEVVWLHSFVERQVLPGADDPPPYLPQPLELAGGRLVLYPLTLEAQMWIDQHVRRLWRTADDVPPVAFAMAHSGADAPEGLFTRLTSRRRMFPAVWSWWWRQRVSRDMARWGVLEMAGRQELVAVDATDVTHARQEGDDAAADPLEWGAVIARVCATYHMTPAACMRLPEGVVVDLYRRAPRHGSVGGELGAGGADEEQDPVRQQAFAHLRLVIRHISRAHKTAAALAAAAVAVGRAGAAAERARAAREDAQRYGG